MPGGPCGRSAAAAPRDSRRVSRRRRRGPDRAAAGREAPAAFLSGGRAAGRRRAPRAARAGGRRSSSRDNPAVEHVGRYRLRRLLGEGASGLVFEAADEDGKVVALKLLRPERAADTVARSRFLREARVARRIRSRHVVPILDVGEEPEGTYLVMPFHPHGSLARRLRTDGRLSLDQTVRLSAELGRGLDALHEHGILHRDVKPSNVLLGDDGAAALTDFGLARAADWTRVTQEGQLL